ncbi:MAG: hypothetical protein ACQETB_00395 [Halobacteriota archaeon]
MNRRGVLTLVGTGGSGVLAGCLGEGLFQDAPRLIGLQVGNWHPDPQTVHVRIESDAEVQYERQVQLPGGDPTAYDRPAKSLDGYPTELRRSTTLSTWVEGTPREEAATLAIGDRSTDCIGVEIDVCPDCGAQKGHPELTVPATPDTLIKHTANCRYSG